MRCLLLVALVILTFIKANSQCNYFAKIDYSNDPVLKNLIINSPDTNFIVSYYNDSTKNNNKLLLAKINYGGDTIWTSTICGNGWINDIVAETDTTIVIAGTSTCIDSNGGIGNGVLFLMRFNLQGDSLTKINFGATISPYRLKKMIATSDSNFVVAMDVSGPVDNIFMFDKNFNQIKTFYVPMNYILDVKQGKNGDIVFCGGDGWSSASWMAVSVDSTLTNINWIQNYGSGGGFYGDWLSTLFVLPDSNLLVSGIGVPNLVLNPLNGNIMDTTKFLANFFKCILWNDSTIIAINSTSLVYYNINSFDTIKSVSGMLGNGYVNWVFDILKNQLGCLTAVGMRYNYGTGKSDRSFFVIFGDTVKLNLGSEEIKTDTELNLSVYPNPSKEKTMVEFENATNELLNYTLSDMQGRVILSSTTKENFIELHKNNNDAGVYFISIKNKDGSVLGRGKILWRN